MKRLKITIISLLLFTCAFSQNEDQNIEKITYVTEDKDTLYVHKDYYNMFEYVWSLEENKNERPTLVMVKNMEELYAKLEE